MKLPLKTFLTFLMLICSTVVFAQDKPDIDALMKQGIALHNEGKYAEAIEKYNEVLKTDPENSYANYELAFSLNASKRPKEAIPYLEKTIKRGSAHLNAASYSLLGAIYDDDHQPQKAIDAYNQAIKTDPEYPQIYYNLGIAYSRNQQYPEAEASAIEAIKRNPNHPYSQRLYALVTFHQNKRVNALMGFCSFILLQPNTALSTEAYGNIQHIIQGGVLKNPDGGNTVQFSGKDDKETGALNLGISMIVLSAQSKKLTGMDALEYELKSIFTLAGQLAEKKADKTFFDKFYVDYFYKLAQSNNMPAFTHTVALNVNKEESATWARANMPQLSAMSDWLKTTQRGF